MPDSASGRGKSEQLVWREETTVSPTGRGQLMRCHGGAAGTLQVGKILPARAICCGFFPDFLKTFSDVDDSQL